MIIFQQVGKLELEINNCNKSYTKLEFELYIFQFLNRLSIIQDPLNPNEKALKIVNPKGSCSSFCGVVNGASIDVKPFGNIVGNESYFEFKVFFHETFDYVKGGKLAGMDSLKKNQFFWGKFNFEIF